MEVVTISRLTDEFVRIPSRGRTNGADIDPTSYTVTVAFVTVGTRPTSGDYAAAVWETDATVSPARYWACRKATALTAGDYAIWIKIATGSETVQELVGTLHVT